MQRAILEIEKGSVLTRRALLGGLVAGSVLSGATRKRPNLVYVFPDQWRAQALGFMGQDPVLTPALDTFSRQSAVFTHAISNAPISRARTAPC